MIAEHESHKSRVRAGLERFQPLSVECWSTIDRALRPQKLRKCEHYSVVGDPLTKVGFVCEGVLRMYASDGNGSEWNKYFLRPGDWVGSSASSTQPAHAAIEALSDVMLLSISVEDLNVLLAAYPEMLGLAHALLAEQFARKQDRQVRLLSQTAAENYRHFRDEYPDLEREIPQYHIASYLGVTPTQLSRLRTRLPRSRQR